MRFILPGQGFQLDKNMLAAELRLTRRCWPKAIFHLLVDVKYRCMDKPRTPLAAPLDTNKSDLGCAR